MFMFDSNNNNVRLIADVVELTKDAKGHVGISIGGGSPHCPCLYVVQIFENSPAKHCALLSVGDEIVAVNGESLRGWEKATVASLIRETQGPVRISFNRIQIDAEKIQTVANIDILLKKFKHRLVDGMDDSTADAIGLSRAILCKDVLARLQQRLDRNQQFYRSLIRKAEDMLRCYQQMSASQSIIGSVLAEIAAKEKPSEDTQQNNNCVKSFTEMANIHKSLGKQHQTLASNVQTMVRALQSHANAAIPDVKQSLAKYLDAKYEYLSYCLRAKELEDEEAEAAIGGDRLTRMESGNYEYRTTLKQREQSRNKFMERRKQVAVKIELLDEKHVRELALQLKNVISAMRRAHEACRDAMAKPGNI